MLKSLFNKVESIQACSFIKKRLQHMYFPVNIAKFLRTPILKNICEWLLLFLEQDSFSLKVFLLLPNLILFSTFRIIFLIRLTLRP